MHVVASIISSQTKHEMRPGSVLGLLALPITVGADLTQVQPYMLVRAKYWVRTVESHLKNV